MRSRLPLSCKLKHKVAFVVAATDRLSSSPDAQRNTFRDGVRGSVKRCFFSSGGSSIQNVYVQLIRMDAQMPLYGNPTGTYWEETLNMPEGWDIPAGSGTPQEVSQGAGDSQSGRGCPPAKCRTDEKEQINERELWRSLELRAHVKKQSITCTKAAIFCRMETNSPRQSSNVHMWHHSATRTKSAAHQTDTRWTAGTVWGWKDQTQMVHFFVNWRWVS